MITGSQETITTYRQRFKLTSNGKPGVFAFSDVQILLNRVRDSYARNWGADGDQLYGTAVTITIEGNEIVASYHLREDTR